MDSHTEYLADEAATLAFGRKLALATSLGGIIYLRGDLGAGKTTLARGILRGYGYEGAVKSPTYTLVEPYEFDQCHIYHFDLYRLADPEEVEFLGSEDYFQAPNLCIVEWPERGSGFLPPADLQISLETEADGRGLRCRVYTGKGRNIAQRLWPGGRNL